MKLNTKQISYTISLLMYGSTIGATRYPHEYKILPKPYHTSKPVS